ncbi:DUF6223 family protein [Streptomyces sp. CL12-4]|uniref:DUF6223 family protein n=1 Tax=Streptomyces sp. CL12-4 TaxID=2810306 RepID=UPI001EFB5D9E|nr:DUF6223 family protein [Streptomyces sp. CL12-4]
MIIGGIALAAADGGVGNGSGTGGAVVAMVVGLAGVVVGALALSRARRAVA